MDTMSKLRTILFTALMFLSMTSISSGQGSCDTQWCGDQYSLGGIYTMADVGIGVEVPQAKLHIDQESGFHEPLEAMFSDSGGAVVLKLQVGEVEAMSPVVSSQLQGEVAVVTGPSDDFGDSYDDFMYSTPLPLSSAYIRLHPAGEDMLHPGRWTPAELVLRAASAGMPVIFETTQENFQTGKDETIESVRITHDGKFGIGTAEPEQRLHVVGDRIRLENKGKQLDLRADGSAVDLQSETSSIYIRSHGPGLNVIVNSGSGDGNVGVGTSTPESKLDVRGTTRTSNLLVSSNVGIGTSAPETELDVDGTIQTSILRITGGADVAEVFEVSQADILEPGMVVVIDATQPGRLKLSSHAYDRTVAGVISGAAGLEPGLVIGETPVVGDSVFPVAITGRVFCWADVSNGPIEPGDLLTTSGIPGHAMKVTDYSRAQGAVIGKAMTGLNEGEGLILVLIALQ
jgi:hypothetical protein